MKSVAILGANGFIGCRLVEKFFLGNLAHVHPIVRTPSSAARLSRFPLDCRVADACDQSALATAFAGCEIVVHTIAGSPKLILEAIAPAYRAAQQAGVRRLVYLSSASVHGQAPPPGTNEESLLSDQQPLEYNNAKVRAEARLHELHRAGGVELVILRPSIVVGPRSYWVASFAEALLANEAILIERAQGICNSIYVDNLVHAVYLAMNADGIDGEAFLVGDREQLTWMDFYRPIAEAFGHVVEDLPSVPANLAIERPSLRRRLRSSRIGQALWTACPTRLRKSFSAALSPPPSPTNTESPYEIPRRQLPQATLEMTLLHTCRYKLPDGKARTLLGYEPLVTFPEASRRTVAWLAFAGYPVRS